MWEKPNQFFAILRCTSADFARRLVNFGSIKFNTPQSWVEEEKQNGKGRGDFLEGAFAACDVLDIESVIANSQLYDDVYGETINGLTYFRRRRTMGLPCYCFFMLRQSLFKLPVKEGKQKISAEIPGEYFRDFADNISKDKAIIIPEKDRPAMVVICDADKFIDMIRQKLISIGVKESEIMLEMVEYVNKKTPYYCKANSPRELKLKGEDFSYQEEGRIIVNTNNNSIKDHLNNNPIEIGSLKGIAKNVEVYLYEGALVEMTVDVYKVDE